MDKKSPGEWIREKRKALGLTQDDVARRAGISVSYISTLEREQRHSITNAVLKPERDKVLSLARALENDPDELLAMYNYAPEGDVYLGKPKNLSELLTVLESIPGFEGINFAESFTSEDLNNLSPDAFQEVVQAVELGIKVVLERQKRRLLSQSPTYAQDQPRPDRR